MAGWYPTHSCEYYFWNSFNFLGDIEKRLNPLGSLGSKTTKGLAIVGKFVVGGQKRTPNSNHIPGESFDRTLIATGKNLSGGHQGAGEMRRSASITPLPGSSAAGLHIHDCISFVPFPIGTPADHPSSGRISNSFENKIETSMYSATTGESFSIPNLNLTDNWSNRFGTTKSPQISKLERLVVITVFADNVIYERSR